MTSPLMFWNKLKTSGNAVLNAVSLLAVGLIASLNCFLLPNAAIAAPVPLQSGIEAMQQYEFAVAIEYFNTALDQGSDSNQVYGHRCLAHLMLNLPEPAIADCSAAIAGQADLPKLRFYRGLAQYRVGEFAAAIADLSEHLQVQREDARAYYNRGLAYFAQGQVSQAIADYHQALTYAAGLQPVEMSNLYNDLGVAYLSSTKPAEALFALDQAVAMDESDPRAYFNRGCVCHHRGDYAAALADFDQVLALDPHHAETYLNRGFSKRQLGDKAGAIADFRAAIEQFQQQGNLAGLQRAKFALHQIQQTPQAVA